MAEALRVVGLAEKAASVLDTVKQKARGAANPRTTATSLSAAEEFRNWARESSVAECRSPDEEQHRDFVPIPLVRQYFKDNDYARLRRILDELDDDLTKYNIGLRTIFDEYLQVMCILIEIREVETLGSLIQHKINDQQLPVDQDKNAFSTVFEPKTWKLFIEHQWRYCVPEFDSQMINTHFQHGCVLPIVSTEMIGQGATATTFKMQIHPLYDSFERISSFQNENTANTYALKSFFARDSKYYLSEIDTYQKLAQSGNPSLVHYYGSYEQDDTYNIVLELADRGSLEQYLSYCQPPTAGLDIIQFWQSLFKIVWGLVCIHEVGGSPYLRGVHSNIKPATILVRDNSLGSQYGWEFKLGGLGNCKFSSNGNFPIKSALTYSYGSPECYLKGQEPSVNFNQNFDIWSLGCIFSEVAVWVASGYHGVQNYRILRATEADHELGDCFHNGKLVLGAVGTAHLQLLSNLRQSDVITAAIVRLVVARMMVPSAHRMTAKQLWQECQGILSQSKATLELEKDKAVLLTAPLNPDRDPRLVRDQQQSNIDTASDMFLTRQDQGITEGSQWSLRSDHSNHVVDKMSLPIRQSQQSSAQFQSSDSPGNINSGYESMPALSERPYSQNSRLASFGRIRPIPKHPKYEVPYLSVKQALQWKEHVQSQGRIGLGSRVKLRYGSSSEELPHSYLGERLRGRKIVFLIDNAATMGAHWPELTRLVGLLAYIAKSDNDIEMFSNHSQQPLKSKKSTTLVKYLERREFVPISAIVTKLKEVFDAYVIELQKEPSVKPMSLYVFSDGLWEPLSDVKSPIHDILQYLRHNYMPIGQVAIQFIRFGHSLSQLDDIKGWDRISGRYDFMDTEHSDGNVWKMLLGAIDLEFESDYDLGETKETVVQNPQTSLRPPEEQVDGYLEEHYKRLRPPLSSPDGSIFTELSQDVTNPLLSHGPDMPIPDLDQIRKSLPLGPTSHVESPPFHDSGYEGSTERQLSLIAKSTHENSFEANHSLPDTQGELNKVGHVESGDGNDTFTEVAVAQDQKYDIRSIISDDLDIQSRRSSKVTYQERLAEENLGYLLARHPQLKPLSEEALHRVGKIRFVDNLRRLLKGYYIDLRPIATTKLEIATVNLLRSRYSRARLSQQISDILDPEIDEMDDHEVRKAAITRQELERWVVGNPEFVSPREPFDDLNVEIDDSSSDDEQVVQKATTSRGKTPEVTEEPNLPNITQMESFLLTCGGGGPFQRLSTHLRIFLLPPTLGPLVRIMMSLPAECVWLDDQEDASLSNKLKAFVEDMTEEKWNWWPLRPRMRPLGKDQMRLNWVCHCGTHLWIELPRFTAEKLQALVQGKPPSTHSPHLCAKRSRNSPSVHERIIQAAGFAQSSTGTSSSAPSSNTAIATTGIQLNRLGPHGPTVPLKPPPATGLSVLGGQGVQVTIAAGSISELVVLFGVKGSRRSLELAQIDVSKHKEDSIFFQDLSREYRQQRGFWRYWFSVWKLRHCDFVKFDKIRANRVISNERHDLPVDKLYEYTPRPPDADMPPIDPHEFELSLSPCNHFCIFKPFHDCIEPPDGGLALERIPKRKEAFELKVGTREQAWGLLTQYSISALLLLVYLIICFVPFVGFWVWWQLKHPGDLQNASTPLMVFATLLAVWFASLVYLKGQ